MGTIARSWIVSMQGGLPWLKRTPVVAAALGLALVLGIAGVSETVMTGKPPWQIFGGGQGQSSGSGHGQSALLTAAGATPSPGASAAAPGHGASPSSHSGSGTGAHPSPSPYAIPTPKDAIVGLAHRQGDPACESSYPDNQPCTVNYSGRYWLNEQVGKVVIEARIDGVVADTKTYVAPGDHRAYGYDTSLVFTVPKGAREVDYQAFLEDPAGNILAQTPVERTYNAPQPTPSATH
jgi:hypothetical protein